MHVRIAWEIYHHQQKQPSSQPPSSNDAHGLHGKQSSASSTPLSSSAPLATLAKAGHHAPDILRPLNNLFSMPSQRPHELSFSSSLLSAAAGHTPPRPPLDAFGPSPLAMNPYARTGFPGYPGFNPLNGLGLPPGQGGHGPSSLYGARDLHSVPVSSAHMIPPGMGLPPSQGGDPWMRAAATPRSAPSLFPPLTPPVSSNSSINAATGWGGLKAEAERERRVDAEASADRHSSSSDNSKRVDNNKSGSESRGKHDDKTDGRHKESHHKSSSSSSSSSSSHDATHRSNGDVNHEFRRSWEHNKGHKREHSRSPVSLYSHKSLKTDANSTSSAFPNDKCNDVKVKEERKDKSLEQLNHHEYRQPQKHGSSHHHTPHRDHSAQSDANRSKELHEAAMMMASKGGLQGLPPLGVPTSLGSPHMPPMGPPHSAAGPLSQMSLGYERARLMSLFGMPPSQHHHPSLGPQFGPGGPVGMDPLKALWGGFFPPSHHVDPFKSLHDFHARPDLMEREHLFQRYNILNSSGGGAPLTEKFVKDGPSHSQLDKEKEQQHLMNLEKAKMMHPSMRPLDHSGHGMGSPYGCPLPPPPPSMPPSLPPHALSQQSSPLFPPNPYLNSLHSLSASAGSNVRAKSSHPHSSPSPVHPNSHPVNGNGSHSSASSSKSSPSPPSSAKPAPVNGRATPLQVSTPPPPVVAAKDAVTDGSSISINTLVKDSLDRVKNLSGSRDGLSAPRASSNPSTPSGAVTNGALAVHPIASIGESHSR